MKSLVIAMGISISVYLLMGCNFIFHHKLQARPSHSPGYKVTFYELGSVRCIPCQKMEGVLESIREKYEGQVNVIFCDVWTPEGKKAAERFTFDAIPTQIFLDREGREYYRHEGFFPEEEVIQVLEMQGVK